MPIIYQALNTVNGKRYIGATKHSLSHRRYQHLSTARGKKPGCRVFAAAIRKYGSKAFHWSVLSTHATIEEMIQAEVAAIKRLRPEYNMTAGGKGLIGLARTPEWTAKAAASNRGKKRSPEQIANMLAVRDISKFYKAVICLDDGVVHESILTAAAYYGISKKGISEVCCGRGLSTNGKHFCHYRADFSEAERPQLLADIAHRKQRQHDGSAKVRSRPVICLNDSKRYPSGISAAKAYGLHASGIMYFCQTGGKTKSGLRFMYADQEKPVEKMYIDPRERIASITALRRSTDSRKKRIYNLDDDIFYESVSAAGRALGRSSGLIAAAIQRRGRCGGKRLAYA